MRRAATLVCVLLAGCGSRVVQDGGIDSASGDGDGDGDCEPDGEEVCDGVDNDCDGEVDEDIAPVTCGEGKCENTVECVNGEMPACEPLPPQPESCNLDDDDCDGEVDEGLGFGPTGPVIKLREDDINTGDCTSCSWALHHALTPTEEGFMAYWRLGLLGGNEEPTLYGRPTDIHGVPTGDTTLQRDDYLLDLYPMAAVEPMPALGMPMEIEWRPQQGHGDTHGILWAHPDGTTALHQPIPSFGPTNVERTVWTGRRFITAWEEDDELRVAALHEDGTLDTMVDVDPLVRPATVVLGVYPGRVGLLVPRVREPEPQEFIRDQWFIVMDPLGNVTVPAHEIDVEYDTWNRVVGTEEGWLHVLPQDWDEPSTRQALEVDGTPIGQPEIWADGRHYHDSGGTDVFQPRPGLNEMIVAWGDDENSTMHVEFLDNAGQPIRGWSGPLELDPGFEAGWLANPSVQFRGDKVLVMWHGLADDATANELYVREFGCVE